MNAPTAPPPKLIFDAHLDLAMNALEWNRDLRWTQERLRRSELDVDDGLRGRARNTVCFPEMRRANFGLCVATQIARSVDYFSKMPGWRSPEQAWAQTQGQLAWYRAMEECGELVQIQNARELETQAARWLNRAEEKPPIAYILSLEGADSILSWRHLEKSYADGLRAIGPVHYGPGIYGHGTDDQGPLTAKGVELLKVMERLGLILDVTHLCDESFWDALKRFSGPIWASHHNCRALANWNRQLADEQIKALIERGAVIGMAFDAIMMVHGWMHKRSRPQEFNLRVEKICEHIDHICQIAGNAQHVGIGTDLDGGYGTEQTPMDLDSIADVARVAPLLASRGYSQADIDGILHGNFLRFLKQHLPRK